MHKKFECIYITIYISAIFDTNQNRTVMTNKKQLRILLPALGILLCGAACAQDAEKPQIDHSYKPLTLKLNEDGSKYVRFLIWHQFWATLNQNNPGTVDVNGKEIAATSDIALRRSRFLAYAQVSPRFLILSHWGINNQSFINGATAPNGPNPTTTPSNQGKKPQLFIHDAWTEYQIVKDVLYVGAGLHYWNGVSRFSSHSTLNFMATDAPIFNWYNIEATDQFARQFGFYAKGQTGRLDYRLHLNKPFVNGPVATKTNMGDNAVNVASETWAPGAYANWMFFDKENNKLPFYVGSYMGARKIFNIGAGFYSQTQATASRDIIVGTVGVDTTVRRHNQLCLGVDAYLDMPVKQGKGGAAHAYLVYYHYDFGPGYLRNIGILNEHLNVMADNPKRSWAGGGNVQPTIGTGSIVYGQFGYALPKIKDGTQFMPYFTLTHKNFERLPEASLQYALGLNYFINAHFAKLTLEYQTRPVYALDGATVTRNGSKGQFILQTQIFL